MRFMSMIRINENTGQVPSEQLMTDMGKLMEEMTRTGQLVSTAGLRPTSEGVRVRLRRGKLSGRWPVHRNEGSDRRLRDPRGEVEGGSDRADRAVPEGPGTSGTSSAKCASSTGRSSALEPSGRQGDVAGLRSGNGLPSDVDGAETPSSCASVGAMSTTCTGASIRPGAIQRGPYMRIGTCVS